MPLPKGYAWASDFENQQRATQRLAVVVPISLLLIFFILFMLFGNMKDAGLVPLNVPFAITGGIAALLLMHTSFSISAGIGFIALFGICIQNLTTIDQCAEQIGRAAVHLLLRLLKGILRYHSPCVVLKPKRRVYTS